MDAPAPPNLDPPVGYTTQWTAPEGVDLFDRAGELVRVAVESGDYAINFGADGKFADFPAFPGYLEAIGAPQDGDGHYTPYYYARSPQKPDTTEWGQYYHLTQLTTDGKTIDATVCGYRLGTDPADNYSLSPIKDAVHVRLSTTADSPGLPGIPDADIDSPDSRAHVLPSWNVFGNWTIDEMINTAYTYDEALAAPCFDWWSAQFPTFTRQDLSPFVYPPDGYVFPTVPADQLQYPEWIGPADPS